MTDEQKAMLDNLGQPPEKRISAYEQLLMEASQNVAGAKHRAVYATALQLLRSRGREASEEYLRQKGIR